MNKKSTIIYYNYFFKSINKIIDLLHDAMKMEILRHIDYLASNSNYTINDILNGKFENINVRLLKDAELNITAILGSSPLDGYRALFCSNYFFSLIKQYILLLQPLVPKTVLKRYGNMYDGGYVLVSDFPDDTIIYSIGISNDVSFDLAMASMGYPVKMFDHTIDTIPDNHPLFTFHPLGIAKNDLPPNLISFETMLQDEKESYNIVLKMDIEGDEWDIFSAVSDNIIKRFRQIVIEMHGFTSFDSSNKHLNILSSLKKLNHFHQVVHIHANNNAPYEIVSGIPFPDVFEVTYVRKSDFNDFAQFAGSYPREGLDQPNVPFKADYLLPFWSRY